MYNPDMSSGMGLGLCGMRIIVDPHMLVPGEPETIDRTWGERLFTLPWRPWKPTKIIIPMVPSKEVIRFNDSWIMHPSVAEQLKREI